MTWMRSRCCMLMNVLDRLAADHLGRCVSYTRGDSTYEAGRKVRPVDYVIGVRAGMFHVIVVSISQVLLLGNRTGLYPGYNHTAADWW